MDIWTIGYEKASQSDVLRALAAAGVLRLIDVRDLPQSRRAGFSKSMLRASLEAVGIEYIHLKPLGTPKEGRLAHRAGDQAAFWAIYERRLASEPAQAALDDLARYAAETPSCLLCFEADWRHCHRARIVSALAERVTVAAHHLTAAPAFL